MRRIALLTLLLGIAPALAAQAPAAPDVTAAAADRASLDAFVAARVGPSLPVPFSFLYDGRPAALSGWTVSSEPRSIDGASVRTVRWSDPATRLAVTATYTVWHDLPAVEWVLRFRNEGSADTPVIEAVQALDVAFPAFASGPLVLHRARGSSAERRDFGPLRDDVVAGAPPVTFGPTAGRSSDTAALPFFNVAGADRGIVAAVGWSGRWTAAVGRDASAGLTLKAGMRRTRFRLRPGEDVRSPSIALLFWKGDDRLDGHNLWRRFMMAHHTPKPGGRPLVLPICAGLGSGGPFPCNENMCTTETWALALMERLRQFDLNPDACWIDAGWYANPTRWWWSGVGTWEVNAANFPRGIRPISDAARAWGGKGFVLWFEPERVYEGTKLDREHPEWLTRIAGEPNRMLNLGDPAARAWLTDHVAGFLAREGITIYRQDFNFDTAPFWDAMDAPDRVGIAEMAHVEGLYAYWDGLLARVPGLLIDNCASGGRRIDLETMSRSIPLWRTDYSYFEPVGYQSHTYGLSLFVPASGTGNSNPARYNMRSSTGGAVVLGWNLDNAFDLPRARDAMAEFRSVRPFLTADYYPLTAYSTSDDAWAAFQWNRPGEQDGIVVAFRRAQAPESTIPISLSGLDPSGTYAVEYDDYGIRVSMSGKEMTEGFAVKIPEAPGSLLIRYKRVM